MGHKTIPVNDRLRAAQTLVAQRDAIGLYDPDGDAGPLLAHIDDLLAQGAEWEEFWAYFAHGGEMHSTSAFKARRREWYEWTKTSTALAELASLMPDEIREVQRYASRK